VRPSLSEPSIDQSKNICSLTDEIKGLTAFMHARSALPSSGSWFWRMLRRPAR
jgi:hypothetical protein